MELIQNRDYQRGFSNIGSYPGSISHGINSHLEGVDWRYRLAHPGNIGSYPGSISHGISSHLDWRREEVTVMDVTFIGGQWIVCP